jgi:type IV pilus assembly protein PilX
MKYCIPGFAPRQRQRGLSLILTLVMLVVIAMTAAASMRGAITGEKVVNNVRLESLAHEYAEIALRYCEDQITLESSARVPTLQDTQLPAPVLMSELLGQRSVTWSATPAVVTAVPAAEISSADSSATPSTPPQCFVDRATLPSTYVVTARGFSPGYSARPDGTTLSGSVVWLQSVFTLN